MKDVIKKKIISLFLFGAVFVVLFSGCAKTQGDYTAEPNTDEPTDKLVVYIPISNDRFGASMRLAIATMKREYPNIDIEVHDFSLVDRTPEDSTAYYDMLKLELMSGKGPDIVVDSVISDFGDIYKVMEANIFYDIDRFMLYDDDFDMSLYNQTVMDAGIYNGRRYVVPTDYHFLQVATTEENLAYSGFLPGETESTAEFLNSIIEYIENADPETSPLIFETLSPALALMYRSGYEYIDYENWTTNIDSDEFRLLMEMYRQCLPIGWRGSRTLTPVEDFFCVLSLDQLGWGFFVSYAGFLKSEQTPHIVPLRNSDRGITASVDNFIAIPAASENKVNAYRFLKVMLDVQPQEHIWYGMPVNIKAFDRRVSKMKISEIWDNNLNRRVSVEVPESAVEEYYLTIEEIDSAVLAQHHLVRDFILPEMQGYFDGTDSYENCHARLKNKLTLYLDE